MDSNEAIQHYISQYAESGEEVTIVATHYDTRHKIALLGGLHFCPEFSELKSTRQYHPFMDVLDLRDPDNVVIMQRKGIGTDNDDTVHVDGVYGQVLVSDFVEDAAANIFTEDMSTQEIMFVIWAARVADSLPRGGIISLLEDLLSELEEDDDDSDNYSGNIGWKTDD